MKRTDYKPTPVSSSGANSWSKPRATRIDASDAESGLLLGPEIILLLS